MALNTASAIVKDTKTHDEHMEDRLNMKVIDSKRLLHEKPALQQQVYFALNCELKNVIDMESNGQTAIVIDVKESLHITEEMRNHEVIKYFFIPYNRLQDLAFLI